MLPSQGSSTPRINERSHETRADIPFPPSPQLTEKAYNLDDPENQQEYCVEQLRRMGIPSRDFAFEPYSNDRKATEIFDPCMNLLKFELEVKMTVKEINKLVALGWLTKERAEARTAPEKKSLLLQRIC